MPMPAVSGPRALHTGDRVSLHLYDGAACLCSETVYNEAGAEQTRLVVAGHSPPSPPRYVSTPRAPSPLPPLESVLLLLSFCCTESFACNVLLDAVLW